MIPTTQDWKDYSEDFSNYQPYILVTKNSDVVWSFTVDNIKEGTLKFTDDVSSLGGFNIGATPSNKFECDIINFDQTFPSPDVFEGCMARLYFFLSDPPTLGGTNAVVGQAIVGQAVVNTVSSWSNDYICRGHYYLDPITSIGSTVHISGSDAMSLEEFNSSNIDGYSFGGKTCMQVIHELGFNIQNTFPNSNYVLPNVTADEEHNMSGISKRTVLGHIASICGCYARHSHTGELELRPLGDDQTVTTLTKIMEEPDVDYYPIEITGAYVKGLHDIEAIEGGSGYYLVVESNPLVTTNAQASTIATHIATLYSGFELIPFSADIIADPSLEAGDIVEFEVNGDTVQSIITSISYNDGGVTQISCEADSDEHATSGSVNSSIGYVRRSLNELYSGDTLKKIINLSGDEVKITANSIDLTGAVFVDGSINCNNTFTVDPDGNVVANSLTSSNANITGGSINIETETDNDDVIWLKYRTMGADGREYEPHTILRSGQLVVGCPYAITPTPVIVNAFHTVSLYSYPYGGGIQMAESNNAQPIFDLIIDKSDSTLKYGAFYLGGYKDMDSKIRMFGKDGTIYLYKSDGTTNSIKLNGADGKVTCVSVTQTSDRNAKEDIESLDKEKSTKFIYHLKPVSFKYKGLDEIHHGFIAQDVEDISDWDLVTEESGKKNLSYIDIIADLVVTVQSQNERIKQLERRLDGIK